AAPAEARPPETSAGSLEPWHQSARGSQITADELLPVSLGEPDGAFPDERPSFPDRPLGRPEKMAPALEEVSFRSRRVNRTALSLVSPVWPESRPQPSFRLAVRFGPAGGPRRS